MTVRGWDLCRDMGGGWNGLKPSGKTAGKKMPRRLRRLSGPNGPLISEGTRKPLRYATAALWPDTPKRGLIRTIGSMDNFAAIRVRRYDEGRPCSDDHAIQRHDCTTATATLLKRSWSRTRNGFDWIDDEQNARGMAVLESPPIWARVLSSTKQNRRRSACFECILWGG